MGEAKRNGVIHFFGRVLLPAVLASLAIPLLLAFSGGPLPGRTGGFGDSLCTDCHIDFPANEGRKLGGVFFIDGVPRQFEPGMRYPVRVVIGQPGQKRFGFQLAARFQDSGRNAGRLIPTDDFTQVVSDGEISYINHTEEGTRAGMGEGPVEFQFEWEAPGEPGAVVFNAGGNAADYSEDPTGDYIYTAGAFSRSVDYQITRKDDREMPAEIRRARRLSETSTLYHLPAPVDLKRGDTEIHIQHRFIQALADSSAGNAFGIDSGANISLGLTHALSDRLAAGISRARFGKVVTLSGVYEVQTSREKPWRLSIVGGVEGRNNFERHYSPYLQAASSFDAGIFRTHVVPMVVFNSRNESELQFRPNPINPEDNFTVSLGLGLDAALTRRLSVAFEYVPRLAGFGGFGEDAFAISSGVRIRTWGHVFSVGLSTSRHFTPAFYGLQGDPDFSLGFNIHRRIRR